MFQILTLPSLTNAVVVKNLSANAGDTRNTSSVSGLVWSLGVGNGNLLQYSCLKNSMDRGTWWVTVYRVAKCWTWLKWLSTHRKNKSQLFWCLELNSSTFVKLSRHSAGEKGWTNKEKKEQNILSDTDCAKYCSRHFHIFHSSNTTLRFRRNCDSFFIYKISGVHKVVVACTSFHT